MSYLIAIATIVSGFSTLVIALLTWFLWKENRALRKAGSAPHLVAYFEMHPDGNSVINIAIMNTGQGAARDFYIELVCDETNFEQYSLIYDYAVKKRGPFTLLPQGEKLSVMFAVGPNLFAPRDLPEGQAINPFHIVLEWKSMDLTTTYRETYLLDINPYSNLLGLIHKPYLLRLTEEMKNINRNIEMFIKKK